jgi:predicted metal-dependent hydrolase
MIQAPLPFDVHADPALPPPAAAPPHRARVFVRHRRARRYVIRVRPDGVVRVTIPRGGSRREAERFADSQRAWVEKELERIEVERHRPRPAPRDANELRMLQARARRELPLRLLALAAEHGLDVSRISIRNQRWRWGSCSRAGHICLNWRLVAMPDWIRDYVMVHELMHLKRMDHSPKFWKLVAAICPEYQAARRWLREHADRVEVPD